MNMHLALSEIRFTRSLWRNILIVFIICALPMWMLIRSFMPSESVVEYLERISEAMPKFDLQIDNEEVRYFAIRDAETVSLVFKKKLVLVNPEPKNQYFLVYREDSLGMTSLLPGKVRNAAPLIGGNYILQAHEHSGKLRFTRRIEAKKST